MTDEHFAERATTILHNLALERKGWRAFFKRWVISDEPLRNDAAALLREAGKRGLMRMDEQYVGDDRGTKP